MSEFWGLKFDGIFLEVIFTRQNTMVGIFIQIHGFFN
jgi:hypothetical protein